MNKRILVFGTACIGMLLFGVCMITLGAILPMLKEKFGLNNTTAGALFSILPFGILSGSLVFGPLADRFGYKPVFILACVTLFLGFQGIAFLDSLLLLKLAVYFFGFGGGALNGATNALVADISEKYKSANLSILGVFYAIGALGMPSLLSLLQKKYSFEIIVASVGAFTVALILITWLVRLPSAKTDIDNLRSQGVKLLNNQLILLFAAILFLQSSLEAIIHNWVTTFMAEAKGISSENALYALSLNVAGMAIMRLVSGSVFRKVSPMHLLTFSVLLMLAGTVALQFADGFVIASIALFVQGAGMAGVFPIMLGFTGERFQHISGTAFSFLFVCALLGNMLINYLLGFLIEKAGIQQLLTVTYIELAIMLLLLPLIYRKLNQSLKTI
jgi:FHS family glucose/mannose:H+ symporter-like MFS transporter